MLEPVERSPNHHKEVTDILFSALPIEQAMATLSFGPSLFHDQVKEITGAEPICSAPLLQACLWLYVDDIDRAHTLVQSDDSQTASLIHAIVHRREGDFSNSRYWLARAAGHPLMNKLDSHRLVDDVERASTPDDPQLLARQRAEWQAVFHWCANHPQQAN